MGRLELSCKQAAWQRQTAAEVAPSAVPMLTLPSQTPVSDWAATTARQLSLLLPSLQHEVHNRHMIIAISMQRDDVVQQVLLGNSTKSLQACTLSSHIQSRWKLLLTCSANETYAF
jgi:hypothetical protein